MIEILTVKGMGAAERRRIMLGELLLRAGVITEAQLRTALAEQKKWGGKLGTLLVEMNFLEEETLVKALSKQLGLPRVDFRGLVISPDALQKLDATFVEQKQILPISYDKNKNYLVVATSDPENLVLIDEIGFRAGCRVKVAIAGEKALIRAIRHFYFADDLTASKSREERERPTKLPNLSGDTSVPKSNDVRPFLEGSLPPATSSATMAPIAEEKTEDILGRIESNQRMQVKVLKIMVELLIKKRVFSREEYSRKVER